MIHIDNADRRVGPHPNMCAPVASSGVKLTDAATGADHTQTVVSGATYLFTTNVDNTNDDTFHFGVADVTAAANVLWVCPPAQTIVIQIPDGITSLHYQSLANGGAGWLRRLQS